MKKALSNAANNTSMNLQQANSNAGSQLSGMSQLNISSPKPAQKMYNPSNAPSPSAMTVGPRAPVSAPPSQVGHHGAIKNAVCVSSGYSRWDFTVGEIIGIPYHQSNTNPNVLPTDPCLAFTKQGPVYSKRRMVIVLWIHHYDMFCVPLFTHNGCGLGNKNSDARREYVCVMNEGDTNFNNDGMHDAIVAKCKYPLKPETSVHLGGGLKVSCKDDISRAGRLTKDSYKRLKDLWTWLKDHDTLEQW